MAISIAFYPTSGYTTPVFPVNNDQTHLITSTNSGRRSYFSVVNVNINDITVDTLNCSPFQGIIRANPGLSSNYLLNNFNYNTVRLSNNPDSVKKINISVGESYSKTVSYSSITSGSSYYYPNVKLNTTTTHDLTANDRVYIIQDNQTINPQYNNYWNVVGTSATQVELDCPYNYTQAKESGEFFEGVEFYDYAYSSTGNLEVTTTNPHNFNSGDSITIAMDGYSTGIIKLISGNTGSLSTLTVNGVDILGGAVSYSTSLAQTASNIATQINLNFSTPDYSAYHFAGSNLIHIYSFRTSGVSSNGYVINTTTTGTLAASSSPSMFIDHIIDSNSGQGWNPQWSNTYVIKDIVTPYKFTLTSQLFNGFDNEPGSQRGSIISNYPYVFTATTTGTTYYIQNASNLYEYDNYATEINTHKVFDSSSKFETIKPSSAYKYYSLNEINTSDIIHDGNTDLNFFVVKAYTSDTQSIDYQVSISNLTSGYTDSIYRRLSFGFGAWNLNNIPNTYITPTPPAGGMINNSVLKYDCYLLSDIFGSIVSETLTFINDCNNNQKYYQIIFLNKFGAYDYYSVTGNYLNSLNISRDLFQKKREQVLSNTNYGIKIENRGNTVYNVDSSKKIKLYSGWLSLKEHEWLQQIYESPEVYLYIPTEGNSSTIDLTSFYPINILDTEVNFPNERSSMKRIEWTAEYSNKRINQGN